MEQYVLVFAQHGHVETMVAIVEADACAQSYGRYPVLRTWGVGSAGGNICREAAREKLQP